MKTIDLEALVQITGGQRPSGGEPGTRYQQLAGLCEYEAAHTPDGYTSRLNQWCGN